MFRTPDKQEPFIDAQDKHLQMKIDDYDSKMLSYIGRLYYSLTQEKMNFDDIKSSIDALQQFNSQSEYVYLNNLLQPEKRKGVKIPSPIPVPSCAFQMHNSVSLTTNSSGNLAIIFNPFFLYDLGGLQQMPWPDVSTFDPDYFSTFYVANGNDLTGSTPTTGINSWIPVNIGQGIPNVYDQYRLVSASIVVKYIGRMDITSGVIGGAIIFDETETLGAFGKWGALDEKTNSIMNNSLSKYGNFDLAMDSFYHQENLCIEGLRELYFPIDPSFEDYTKLFTSQNATANGRIIRAEEQYYKSGFNYMIYVLGAPPGAASFKVDVYCNFECLPNAQFLNYMPISPNSIQITSTEKQNAIATVQQNPITKANTPTAVTPYSPSMWQILKNKFSNSLPGIAKLLSSGLISSVPYLKPGIAIANTILSSMSNQQKMETD